MSVRKQHSLVQNIIVFKYIAKSESCPAKALSGTRLGETAPNGLVFIPSREKAILAATKVELVIYNRWKINPEYEKLLS